MTPKKTNTFLNKTINDAEKIRKQLSGYKANVTKKYNKGAISEAERQMVNKRLDDTRAALDEYIAYFKLKKIKGYGVQRGSNVVFFNNEKQLLKKLELIIGEISAGNTSIQMRNTGVAILDTLFKMSIINRPQYNKLYNQYFKI